MNFIPINEGFQRRVLYLLSYIREDMRKLWERVEKIEDGEESFEPAKDLEDLDNLEEVAREPAKAKFMVSVLNDCLGSNFLLT